MRSHRRSWILGLTGVVLAGLVAGVQAASDLTDLVFLANRDSHELVVIDAATDQIISRVAVGRRPHMTVLSAAGKVYTTGTGTNDVTVVDAATLRVERKIPVQAKGPEHAALSPDGQFLWVANVAGNAVSVIDLAAAKTVQVVKGLSQPHNIVFAPDGKAYVTQVGSYRVAVFTPGKATPVARIAAGSPARLASLHPQKVQGVNNAALAQGLLFATNQDAGEVAVIDSARDAVVKVIPVGREPWEPYETPDHTKILVPNLADRTVSVIDVPSQKVLATLPGGKDMTGVVVTADSKKAYVVRRGDNKVSVIDLERLQVTGEIAVGRSPEVATRTAGGKIYVANSGSGSVSVIDAGSDRVLTTITKVGKYPWALASFNGYNYCH